MNLLCYKENLEKYLNLASRNIGKNNNIPILQGGLLEANQNKLIIQTTNLETGFKIWFSVDIIKEGKIIIPIKILSDFISQLDEEKINLEIKNNHLYISNKNTKTFFKSYPLNEFPVFPKITKNLEFDLKIETFLKPLKLVAGSVAKNEIWPELSSVCIFSKDNNLKFVATDSFRLSEKKINNFLIPSIFLLLPQKSTIELIKILESLDQNSSLKIIIDENQVLFEGENFQYVSVLNKKTFPDYEKNIPTSFTTQAVLNLKNLLKTLSLANIFSSKLNEIFLFLDSKRQILEIKTNNAQLGEYSSQLPAKISGETISLTFNYHYILEGLNNINGDEVLFQFAGELKPLLITSNNDQSYFYLVMPMKNY